MKPLCLLLFLAETLFLPLPLSAQVPQALNYQGRVTVNGNAFTGTGQFRFSIVDGSSAVLWSSHASAFTSAPVSGGLYTVRLGDTTLANMAAVPSSLFSNSDLRLRVWFNDGVNGVQQLTPDQRLAPVGYAHRAASVDSVPSSAIAPGSIQPSQLAPSVQSTYAEEIFNVPASGGTAAITFANPFQTAPSVTVDGVPVPAANVTPTGFTIAVPVHNLVVDTGTPASNSVGKWMDMILVGGNPAIAYTDDTTGDLKYVRALNPAGSAWAAPVTVDSGGAAIVGAWCSMAVVSGSPAIAYYDETNKDLKYVRASNATGTSWNAPVTVASHATNDLGKACRLKTFTVNVGVDRPVIAYMDATAGTVRMTVSNNTTGTSWGSPQTPVPSLAGFTDTSCMDLDAAPGGLPIIIYYNPADDNMFLVKSTGILGGGWDTPSRIDGGPNLIRGGKVTNVDLFMAGGELALKFSNSSGTFAADQIEDGSLSQDVICGPVVSARIVEGTFPLAVFESGDSAGLAWATARGELGTSWTDPRDFGTGQVTEPHTLSAVRLTDGSILAAYPTSPNNGQLTVCNTAAPSEGLWKAGITAPIMATALAPGAIKLENLPANMFGGPNYRAGLFSFAIGSFCNALGEHSIAMGYNTIAGEESFVAGSYNIAGYQATALGYDNHAMGDNATCFGTRTNASGLASTAMGSYTAALGDFSLAAGRRTSAETSTEISLGSSPTSNTGSATAWVGSDRLLELGNGDPSTGLNSNALTILKDGRIGVGDRDTPAEITHALTLPGGATAATGQARAVAWTTYSDSRIKTEQRPITYGLKEIMQLQPRAYTQHSGCVKDGKFECEDAKGGTAATIGFIAQEVEKIIPEAVQKPEDPANQLYGMSYEKLIPVLVKSAQELKSENDALKAQMAAMEARLEKLERPQPRKR